MRRVLVSFLVFFIVLGSTAFAQQGPLASSSAITATERLLDVMPEKTLPAACCKMCSKGKACGDSCISRSKTCRKGVGCACDR